jgi:hypothetical protein
MTHFNRATHADPYRNGNGNGDPFTAYTAAFSCFAAEDPLSTDPGRAANMKTGTPQTVWSYNGGLTRAAVVVYARYMREPRFEREPTADELRLIVDYCAHYIHAPCLVETDELRLLRLAIVRVTTPEQLAGWLWGCSTIGIAVLGGL